MSRKWVANASPVILLAKIGRVAWLEALATELVIPTAVADEVGAGPAEDSARHWLEKHGRAYIRAVKIDPTIAAWDLGAGESEVLSWARQNAGYEALVDDAAARKCAKTLQIPVRGTLGIVLLAKRAGLTTQVAPVFQELLNADLRIAPEVLRAALKLAGEQ